MSETSEPNASVIPETFRRKIETNKAFTDALESGTRRTVTKMIVRSDREFELRERIRSDKGDSNCRCDPDGIVPTWCMFHLPIDEITVVQELGQGD